jgi:hypothetical protein
LSAARALQRTRAFSDYVAALFWSSPGIAREDGRKRPYDPAIHPFAKAMDPRVKPAGDEGEWRSLIGKCSGAMAQVPMTTGRAPTGLQLFIGHTDHVSDRCS